MNNNKAEPKSVNINERFAKAMGGKKLGSKATEALSFLETGAKNVDAVEQDEKLLRQMNEGIEALQRRDRQKNIQQQVHEDKALAAPEPKKRGRPPAAPSAAAENKVVQVAAKPRFKDENEELLAKAKVHLQIQNYLDHCAKYRIDLQMPGITLKSSYEQLCKHRAQIEVRINAHSAKGVGERIIESSVSGVEVADVYLQQHSSLYRGLDVNLTGFGNKIRSEPFVEDFERLKDYIAIKYSPFFSVSPEVAMVTLFVSAAAEVNRDNQRLAAREIPDEIDEKYGDL